MLSEYRTRCATAAERRKMGLAVRALALRHQVDRLDHEKASPRRDWLTIQKGPYCVSVAFDGNSRNDMFLAHWYTAVFSDATYPSDFGVTICGTRNDTHGAKATSFSPTFDGLLASLDAGLSALRAK